MNSNPHQFPDGRSGQPTGLDSWHAITDEKIAETKIAIPVSQESQHLSLIPITFSIRTDASGRVIRRRPISIRPFSMEDAMQVYEAARESVETLCTTMTWCHANYSLEDSQNFVLKCAEKREKKEEYSFAIIDETNGGLLGSIGLNQISRSHNFANVGYWVRRSQTGNGIASAATRLIASVGLEQLGFSRLEMIIAVDNIASQRVAQKAGAKFEGILRNRLILNGKSCHAALYSLVAEDLQTAVP